MDEPGKHYAEWEESDTKGHTGMTSVECLEQADPHRQKVVARGGRRGVTANGCGASSGASENGLDLDSGDGFTTQLMD